MSDSLVLELKKSAKSLQAAANEQDLVSILTGLKDKKVTEAILRESKIGLAVGKLRTNKSKAVSDLSKEIVKSWKASVEKAKAASGHGGGGASASAGGSAKVGDAKKPGATPTSATGAAVRSSKTDGVSGSTGDKTRDKCIELIYDSLAFDASAPIDHVLKKASAVEAAVFKNHDSNPKNKEYTSKIRSLYVNLKDKANPGLRASIVDGGLAPEKFAVMTSQDMASEERKAADQKIREENFHKALSAGEKQAETDAFQCSRCKQRKCIYRQQQTRSADEPMTTFVTCTVCNNRWKFS